MKRLVLLCLFVAGCGHKTAPLPVITGTVGTGDAIAALSPDLKPSDPPEAAQLKAVAKQVNVHFRVYCYDDSFFGVAWDAKYGDTEPNIGGADDESAVDGWIIKAETQRKAIRTLIIELQRGPNMHPYHLNREPEKPKKTMICPPEIRG